MSNIVESNNNKKAPTLYILAEVAKGQVIHLTNYNQMNTNQKYDATASGASSDATTNTSPNSSIFDTVEGVTLHVDVYGQAWELFYALQLAREKALYEIIADFSPNALESHVDSMLEVSDLDDLMSQLVQGLCNNVKRFNQSQFEKSDLVDHRAKYRQGEVKKWKELVKFHPNRKGAE